jgi:hypothetical protein
MHCDPRFLASRIITPILNPRFSAILAAMVRGLLSGCDAVERLPELLAVFLATQAAHVVKGQKD